MGKSEDGMDLIYRTQIECDNLNSECLVQGACVNCTYGNVNCIVHLLKSHGRYISERAQLTANDVKLNNISGFGRCLITDKICKPILHAWMNTNANEFLFDENTLDQENTPNTESYTVCSIGGVVVPDNSGQQFVIRRNNNNKVLKIPVNETKTLDKNMEYYGHINVDKAGAYSFKMWTENNDVFTDSEVNVCTYNYDVVYNYTFKEDATYKVNKKYIDEEYTIYGIYIDQSGKGKTIIKYLLPDGAIVEEIPPSLMKTVLYLEANKDYYIKCNTSNSAEKYYVYLEPNLDRYLFTPLIDKGEEEITNSIPEDSNYGAVWLLDESYQKTSIYTSTREASVLKAEYILYFDRIMGGIFYYLILYCSAKPKDIVKQIKDNIIKVFFETIKDAAIDKILSSYTKPVEVTIGVFLSLIDKYEKLTPLQEIADKIETEAKIDLLGGIKATKYPYILKIGTKAILDEWRIPTYKFSCLCERWAMDEDAIIEAHGESYADGKFYKCGLDSSVMDQLFDILEKTK